MDRTGLKLVYTVVRTPDSRITWVRVGCGWPNRDGSLSLRLDAIPTNGMLQVRDIVPANGAARACPASQHTKGEKR